MQIQSLSPVVSMLGESPVWHTQQQSLYWVDIFKPSVHRLHIDTQQHQEWPLPETVGCIALRDDRSLWAAMGDGVSILHLPDMRIEKVVSVIDTDAGFRMNDGKCDAKGRFWFGSVGPNLPEPEGSFYCLDLDGKVSKKADGYVIPNGIGWSADQKTMYHNDSLGRGIYKYRFDLEAGTIDQRETFYTKSSESEPDGMAIDQQGNLWVAQWNGFRIDVFNPAGKIIKVVDMPMQRPTSCAFDESYQRLFVTSCSQVDGSEEKLAEPSGQVHVLSGLV